MPAYVGLILKLQGTTRGVANLEAADVLLHDLVLRHPLAILHWLEQIPGNKLLSVAIYKKVNNATDDLFQTRESSSASARPLRGDCVVADFVADQRHQVIFERRDEHPAERAARRRAAFVIDNLQEHVLGVHVIAAVRTFA